MVMEIFYIARKKTGVCQSELIGEQAGVRYGKFNSHAITEIFDLFDDCVTAPAMRAHHNYNSKCRYGSLSQILQRRSPGNTRAHAGEYYPLNEKSHRRRLQYN
jgi:hypothetical protein